MVVWKIQMEKYTYYVRLRYVQLNHEGFFNICEDFKRLQFEQLFSFHAYVSLQLRVQNRRRKWHFPPNFRNGIIWTAPFLLNIRNGIIWGDAFSKAFRSSEALISVLSKNARLCFRSSEALISVLSKNARLYDNI